ncbi:hypothetical protein [Natronosalvus caseinilyticus]|uniref:hypothetical protein n=1 Tax=Natronosalvus caseinilyticus TaxID=2953747 RepID=UPI0028A8F32C|nr:hypothetical protein [Natronosalvus caseinilyticus]
MTTTSRRHDSTDGARTYRTLVLGWIRLLADLAILTLWTVFLALLFLETAWPRWAFYALLVGGAAGYVAITAPWIRVGAVTRQAEE